MMTAVPIVSTISWVETPRPARKGIARIMGTTHRSWKHENAYGQTAVRRFQFAARGKAAQDDRGAGYGDHTTQEHCGSRRQPEPTGQDGSTGDREPHLNAPTQQNGLPEATEALEGDFQADPEEQEHHADLGQNLDLGGYRPPGAMPWARPARRPG